MDILATSATNPAAGVVAIFIASMAFSLGGVSLGRAVATKSDTKKFGWSMLVVLLGFVWLANVNMAIDAIHGLPDDSEIGTEEVDYV